MFFSANQVAYIPEPLMRRALSSLKICIQTNTLKIKVWCMVRSYSASQVQNSAKEASSQSSLGSGQKQQEPTENQWSLDRPAWKVWQYGEVAVSSSRSPVR